MTERETGFEINLITKGPMGPEAEDQADRELRKVAAKAPRPVIFGRAKLIHDEGRADDETCIAQGVLDVSGTLIRAQVAAPSMREAIDGLGEQLERNLRRRIGKREAEETRPPRTPPGEWRSGDLPTRRPSYFPRPREEREVVRHKTYGPTTMTPEEAAFDMEALDYRFFLFTLPESGEDAIVFERDDGTPGLRLARGGEPTEAATAVDFEVNPAPAPSLTLEEARDRLDNGGEPFVFYCDPDNERARVLYRRYDGHYGLIEPRRG